MQETELLVRVWFLVHRSAGRIARCRGLLAEDALDLAGTCFLSISHALAGRAAEFADAGDLERYVATSMRNGRGRTQKYLASFSQLDVGDAEQLPDLSTPTSVVILRPELLPNLAPPGSDAEYALEVVVGLRDDSDPVRLSKGLRNLADAVRKTLNWRPGEFSLCYEEILEELCWTRLRR